MVRCEEYQTSKGKKTNLASGFQLPDTRGRSRPRHADTPRRQAILAMFNGVPSHEAD
jgi:hypothetical protein